MFKQPGPGIRVIKTVAKQLLLFFFLKENIQKPTSQLSHYKTSNAEFLTSYGGNSQWIYVIHYMNGNQNKIIVKNNMKYE